MRDLQRTAGRDSRKGTARAAEAMAPRPWGTHWKETDQTALERKVPLEPGCDPNSLRSQPEEHVARTVSSKGTGAGELKSVGPGLASVVSDLCAD